MGGTDDIHAAPLVLPQLLRRRAADDWPAAKSIMEVGLSFSYSFTCIDPISYLLNRVRVIQSSSVRAYSFTCTCPTLEFALRILRRS